MIGVVELTGIKFLIAGQDPEECKSDRDSTNDLDGHK
jgi:hypothetical protein